jgi:nucleoid-associated protein YgaU
MRTAADVLRRIAAPLALLPLVAACAGSAPTGGRSWDVSAGDYLTEEEYGKLSRDEAMDYCRQLTAEIDIQNDNAAAANERMPDIQSEIERLQAELDALKAENGPLSSEVASLEQQLEELKELPRSYTVVKDDWLRKISATTPIYRDEEKWKRIFRANRDKIDDPNLIYPGQVFLIPRGLPTTHTVREGETLRIIAGYWEVYGDRSQSDRIYEANRDKIDDPNVIHPGMVLTIPR